MMPDVLQTLKSEVTSTSSAETLNALIHWNNTVSQPLKQDVITQAVIGGSFGLNKAYSLKQSMFESKDPSSTKLTSVGTSSLLQNISTTVSTILEDNEISPMDDNEPFQMEFTADLIWTVVFGSMIGCAILGNLVVIWIVLGKSILNYFLLIPVPKNLNSGINFN